MAKILRFRIGAAEPPAPTPVNPPAPGRPAGEKPYSAGRTDARPYRNFPSDARPADGSPKAGVVDPEVERRRRFRRRGILFILVLIFLGGTAATIFGDRGYLAVKRSQRDLVEIEGKVAETQARVTALKRDVDQLRTNPAAIERIAREELGFVRQGEVTFLLEGEEPQKKASPR